MSADESEHNGRKRRRAAHACDTCRHKKIRCDGRQPCTTCITSQQECVYGAEASSRGKSELILAGVLRMEKHLHDMSSMIATNTHLLASRPAAAEVETPRSAHLTRFSGDSPNLTKSPVPADVGDHNAVLSSLHTSTTESVLQWPHFDHFSSLRQDYVPIFHLEQSRPSLASRPSEVTPFLSGDEVRQIIQSFQSGVNFIYPTISRVQLDTIQQRIISGKLDNSVNSCLALLVMALGCANQSTAMFYNTRHLGPVELDYQRSRRSLSEMYFDGVLKRLHNAHIEITTDATQCLFFVALYFGYLQRPLQSWSYMNMTAARCRLLLSYMTSSEPSVNSECIRRIFWSCYILESDYIAELSALPLSGIASIESSIPLPGEYNTHTHASFATSSSPAFSPPILPHTSSDEQELSSLYFLACLSMRRLLNRVHDLLYSVSHGASLDPARFPIIVAELSHQLEEWRDLLPSAFRFTVDTRPAQSQHGGFLRQRYLTCKGVIYRPYLTWVLNSWAAEKGSTPGRIDGMTTASSAAITPDMIDKCEICLETNVLHLLNLRGFAHTVLTDTWICTLSMACGMLILLAACRVPSLQGRLSSKVTTLGPHLLEQISQWMRVPGDEAISPSVEQSVRMIGEVSRFIEAELKEREQSRNPGHYNS